MPGILWIALGCISNSWPSLTFSKAIPRTSLETILRLLKCHRCIRKWHLDCLEMEGFRIAGAYNLQSCQRRRKKCLGRAKGLRNISWSHKHPASAWLPSTHKVRLVHNRLQFLVGKWRELLKKLEPSLIIRTGSRKLDRVLSYSLRQTIFALYVSPGSDFWNSIFNAIRGIAQSKHWFRMMRDSRRIPACCLIMCDPPSFRWTGQELGVSTMLPLPSGRRTNQLAARITTMRILQGYKASPQIFKTSANLLDNPALGVVSASTS